ncbi:NADH-quinone oxidoreductase subunit C [Dechloromonas sp. TW-R-39-2]|uniref:NADH-quinone oxidoreductase subunit C n=1 Tax=Dechloromonas sp. TW-R-39-2 TaxID=2654218 RepID=UPI00193D5657|nr:NADH-quinone oxidoreductase subunit C [Dechloromonas sp. TW-R-39-2]QRM20326.1 NADH-quinone oxidoreductase subunit C [Dechloromonas sp. TW-R-39-2]
MSAKLETLSQNLQKHFGEKLKSLTLALGEVTIEVASADYFSVMQTLRDEADLGFDELIDLCGVDYSTYGDGVWQGKRFAAVSHLLSIPNNWRLRVRVFAEDDAFPAVDSVTSVWTSVNWFEREAFDLFGIAFVGHDDLRRILTDYGFIGHPFRKDFPISGHVEMRYDPDQARVIYQPVTIEPRENTPRIVREDTYGDPAHG